MSQRSILLCVTGLSPQIITETLYALLSRSNAKPPEEIHLITTEQGAEQARLTLLDPRGRQHFFRLCAEFGVDADRVRFNSNTIHLIGAQTGQVLADIRTPEDNAIAADTIFHQVRKLSSEQDCTIHASIAGGRKTMGFFLGYAMSLFAREQDELSHVLVNPPFESHPEFFYPPAEPQVLELPDGRSVSTRQADVMLASIPFVRLREQLPAHLLEQDISFNRAVALAQARFSPPKLHIDLAQKNLTVADNTFQLPPAELAFFTIFACMAQHGHPGVLRKNLPHGFTQTLWELYLFITSADPDDNPLLQVLEDGQIPVTYFDQRRSRCHLLLRRHLAEPLAKKLYISQEKRNAPYRLNLKREFITISPNEITRSCQI